MGLLSSFVNISIIDNINGKVSSKIGEVDGKISIELNEFSV